MFLSNRTSTTIRQPLSAMAEQAALALIRNGAGDIDKGETVIVPAELRIRESTGPAP